MEVGEVSSEGGTAGVVSIAQQCERDHAEQMIKGKENWRQAQTNEQTEKGVGGERERARERERETQTDRQPSPLQRHPTLTTQPTYLGVCFLTIEHHLTRERRADLALWEQLVDGPSNRSRDQEISEKVCTCSKKKKMVAVAFS